MFSSKSLLRMLASGFMVLIVSVFVQGAYGASVVDEITIPITGATYDASTGNFTVSGRPNGITSVFFNDGRTPNPVTFDFVVFDLSTINLTGTVSPDGLEVSYVDTGNQGDLSLLDGNNGFDPILEGDLVSLEMKIIDPALGAFEGEGVFNVTGGSLASDFGNSGGLATIGISFTVPTSFNDSFAALANTKLVPKEVAHAPLPSAAWAGLGTVGLLLVGRKKLQHFIGM